MPQSGRTWDWLPSLLSSQGALSSEPCRNSQTPAPGAPPGGGCSLSPVPLAEVNAISENTETLRLSPQGTTEYVGRGADQRPQVCERSCEELSGMVTELSGLHAVVSQLHESLRKVVGAGEGRAQTQGERADHFPPRVGVQTT